MPPAGHGVYIAYDTAGTAGLHVARTRVQPAAGIWGLGMGMLHQHQRWSRGGSRVLPLLLLLATRQTAALQQRTIPRIEALPSVPNSWEIIDFRHKAEQLHRWLFSPDSPAVNTSIFLNVSVRSAWFNGTAASLPSYLGETQFCSVGPGEGLAAVGVVYGSALLGKQGKSAFGGVSPEFITGYSDPNGIAWNNPPGLAPAPAPTFWYGLMNSFMLYSALDKLELPVRHRMLAAASKQWQAAAQSMSGDFAHTGFDFNAMKAIDNGRWTEGDSAAGIALLAVWAAHDAQQQGGESALSLKLAHTALTFLDQQTVSPLYECVMPQGVLAAARMNALAATAAAGRPQPPPRYNVSKMLEFALSDGHNQFRHGWGMLAGGTRWGGHDVGGLIGSITDGGGYAFMGNGLWNLAALAPVPRYAPEFSRAIAKWIANLANAAKYFYADTVAVQGKQSNPSDPWDIHDVVAYEGLRKCDYNRTAKDCLHGPAFGPFATGDWCEALNCTHITDICKPGLPVAAPCNTASDRVLYGGGALGVLGVVVGRTNESSVLRIDVTATDVYATPTPGPLLLYWNPTAERVWVEVVAPKGQCEQGGLRDLVDYATGAVLTHGVECSEGAAAAGGGQQQVGVGRGVPSVLELAPDTVVLVSLPPTHS